ncbi:hypothetical protein [Acidianus sp. HS-5]|uniref:hypothetical protein n=1 Tax=Acidianus sp. HS-5 TaxID=2886040 RepID=UPI001F2C9CBB|nr:hypothetical protein [Acidianus sp. HS-5]BDC17284.1 hypothetical protein HS5_01740 [Acidianus sp. HS-5]
MCDLKFGKIERPILDDKVVLLRKEFFDKLSDEKFMYVLSTHDRGSLSKSYFYLIVDKLRESGLLMDNAVSFSAVLPFKASSEGIWFADGLLYRRDKELFYINMESDRLSCESCPIFSHCIYAIKTIAKDRDIPLIKENPREEWKLIIDSFKKEFGVKVASLKILSFK